MEETICQLCGDVGAQNALVFCVRCLDFAIHRYCLDVIPETLDEFVRWFCVDCEEKYGKPYPDKEHFSVRSTKLGIRALQKFPSLGTKPLKMKHKKLTKGSSQHELMIQNVTKVNEGKEISGLVQVTAEKSHMQPHKIKNAVAKSDKLVHDCPTKANKSVKGSLFVSPVDIMTGPEEKKDQYSPCEGDNENVIFEEGKLCTDGADVTTKEKERNEKSGLVKVATEKRYLRPRKIENLVAKSDKVVHDCPAKANKLEKSSLLVGPVDVVTDPKEKKDQYSPCEGNNENVFFEEGKLYTAGSDVAEISLESKLIRGNSSNILLDGEYIRVQPVIDQIWRGSLDIETDGRGLYDGLVAHLSNKACPKVWEEASLLSESICMELVPKVSVWPKRFQKLKPSDNIALYFFPLDQKSCIKVYNKLVSEMLSHELALKAMVTNAQLLVFTSYELPDTYWKCAEFEGKFYLWGVFVAKQAAVSDTSAKNQPMIPNGEENMALDSLSPKSTLNSISSSGN